MNEKECWFQTFSLNISLFKRYGILKESSDISDQIKYYCDNFDLEESELKEEIEKIYENDN